MIAHVHLGDRILMLINNTSNYCIWNYVADLFVDLERNINNLWISVSELPIRSFICCLNFTCGCRYDARIPNVTVYVVIMWRSTFVFEIPHEWSTCGFLRNMSSYVASEPTCGIWKPHERAHVEFGHHMNADMCNSKSTWKTTCAIRPPHERAHVEFGHHINTT